MSKITKRVHRKDKAEDHVHSLKDGQKTGGRLLKPEAVLGNEDKLAQGWHTHLYQLQGKTLETGVSPDEPGHSHTSLLGESSGPLGMK